MNLYQQDAIKSISNSYSTGDFQQLRLISSRQFLSLTQTRGLSLSKEHLDYFTEFLPPIWHSDDGEQYFHPYQICMAAELRKRIEPNFHWSQWESAPVDRIQKYLGEIFPEQKLASTIFVPRFPTSMDYYHYFLWLNRFTSHR